MILSPESPIAVSGLSDDNIAEGVLQKWEYEHDIFPHFILALPSDLLKYNLCFCITTINTETQFVLYEVGIEKQV